MAKKHRREKPAEGDSGRDRVRLWRREEGSGPAWAAGLRGQRYVR